MIRTKIPFLLLVLLLGNALQARDFWLEKDYGRWSEKECRKLLTNSPWSKRYTLTQAHIEMIGATPSSDRQRERNARIEYHVQLRSAPPLRQAQVRLAQIRSNYEEMSPEKRQGFDNQAAQILRDSFDDLVGVHVTYGSNVLLWDRELARYWRSQSTEQLKNSTYLIGHGGRRAPLLQYTKGKGAAQEFLLLFPRSNEGEALISREDKRLLLEFTHPPIGGEGGKRVLVEFSVKKMVVEGEAIY